MALVRIPLWSETHHSCRLPPKRATLSTDFCCNSSMAYGRNTTQCRLPLPMRHPKRLSCPEAQRPEVKKHKGEKTHGSITSRDSKGHGCCSLKQGRKYQLWKYHHPLKRVRRSHRPNLQEAVRRSEKTMTKAPRLTQTNFKP